MVSIAISSTLDYAPWEELRYADPMEFCDLKCRYADWPKDDALDGSGSCRTFQALFCLKKKRTVHKNAPCAEKEKGIVHSAERMASHRAERKTKGKISRKCAKSPSMSATPVRPARSE
ncbi:MAG: hypothetical protein C4576_22200 [Desulfobacteraceae bacterium]|nr:MAG: hypothetical protein C4576_22200 [Desulfobacteraceae bacterium]